MIKFSILALCLVFPCVSLHAQIELINVVDDVEIVEDTTGVLAPTGGDHSVAVKEGRVDDRLFFLNEDQISGALLEMSESEGVVWKHPDASTKVSYGLANLKKVELKTVMTDGAPLSRLPKIILTNGDAYRGKIVHMDADVLQLESPMAGTFTLQSKMVAAIRPSSSSGSIYEGPSSLEEWELNNSNGNWKYEKNALFSDNHNQIIGQEFDDLPDMVSLAFDLEWRGNCNLQVGFWGRDPKNVNQNCYTLNIQNGYIRCYRNYDKIGRNDLGNIQVRDKMNDGSLEVELLLNRAKKEIMILFDGELVARWSDTFEGNIRGDAMLFGGMGNNPLKLSNIRLREWDGEFDMGEDQSLEDTDQLTTSNGDVFAGTLEKIEAEVLYFKNDFAVFQVPMDRVDEVRFAQGTRREPRLQKGDVKISFPNTEVITLSLLNMDQRVFTGKSEATGEITLQKKYFDAIQFNPYDDRHEEEEDLW
ncbi:hypothetical protein P3T73_00355 [Kiritimatiellota bacterium B12222]|nr:hypothetical protein P3T73_00355 [Kiritimatiellota bacterium B12222]